MNTAVISGKIGGPGVRLRYTDGGKPELSLTVECAEVGRNGDTFRTWVAAVIVGPKAESLGEVLEVGDVVAIAGKLSYRKIKRRDGTEESKLMVIGFDAEVITRAPVTDEGIASEGGTPELALMTSEPGDVPEPTPSARKPRRSNHGSKWGAGPGPA